MARKLHERNNQVRRWRESQKPRLKNAIIKCHVMNRDRGKIMVTDKYKGDRVLEVNPKDIEDQTVKITLILNPQGIWAIFRTNEPYKPFEIRDEDLVECTTP